VAHNGKRLIHYNTSLSYVRVTSLPTPIKFVPNVGYEEGTCKEALRHCLSWTL